MRIQIVNPNLSGDVSILDIGQTYLTTYINERTEHRAATVRHEPDPVRVGRDKRLGKDD